MTKTILTKNSAVIITAAGTSQRFGEKKEYLPLNGYPDRGITVLSQSLYTFVTADFFTRYVLTVPAGDIDRAERLLNADSRLTSFFYTKRSCLAIVPGGASRQESVYAGLLQLKDANIETVLVHDGARPWVSVELIGRVLAAAGTYGAAVPIIPVTDTQKEIDDTGKIIRHLRRDHIFGVQTPQGFCYDKLVYAHRCAVDDGGMYTDDSEIYAAYCDPVYTCEGSRENKKITYRGDLGVPV